MIFLISGYARAGKDSVAEILKKKLHGTSLIIHNADSLKFYLKQYAGWDGEKTEESRNLLQQFGNERTKIALNKPFFWIEKTCDIIEIFKNEYNYFLVPDTRFLSEIYYTKARFQGVVATVRVERLGFENGLTQCQKNHSSEKELENYNYDYYIKSESGLDCLEKEVDKFILGL